MKTILSLITAAAAVLSSSAATNTVTLEWDQPPDTEYITHYILLTRTNIPPGFVIAATNAPYIATMYAPSSTNGWSLSAIITNTNSAGLIRTNRATVPRLGTGPQFFTLIAANGRLESPLSCAAWIPAVPTPRTTSIGMP